MRRLVFVIFVFSSMAKTGTCQTMNVHVGDSVSQFDLTEIDSITFSASAAVMEMVAIPAGTFTMGQDGTNGIPEHQVTLTHDYFIGATEVTNQQYLEAVQWAFDNGHVAATSTSVSSYGEELLDLDNPDCEIAFSSGRFSLQMLTSVYYEGWDPWGPGYAYPDGYNSANHPVKAVSWYGSACYCDWLSLMNDLPAFYQGTWDQTASHDPYLAQGFRLPTEAEWEYAARFNDGRTYPWGEITPTINHTNFNSHVGWTTPVGSYPLGASQLGLLDLSGNLREWVGDWYILNGGYGSGSVTDPYGPTSGTYRAIRDGFWTWGAGGLGCAWRNFGGLPTYAGYVVGFRPCRTN